MASSSENFTACQLMQMDACTRCGECQRWCDTYTGAELSDPRQKLKAFRSLLKGERLPGLLARLAGGRKFSAEDMKQLSKGIYECTLCGRCTSACPVRINLLDLWVSMRQELVARGVFPEGLGKMKDAIAAEYNVFSYPKAERGSWAEFAAGAPDDLYRRERAEAVYFVGCIASFSPAVQSIPESFTRLLTIAGEDFTILGNDEWCCGFPLIAAGMRKEAEELKKHNIEMVRKVGAKRVVFSCPSCYRVWNNEYRDALPDVEFLHSTQLITRLLGQGRLKPGAVNRKVTYHDPCDLGRNSGVYEEPRRAIASIPGLTFVGVAQNRERGWCCGGGGDLEVSNPDLVSTVSTRTYGFLKDTGADTIVTACQQCKRMLLRAAEKDGNNMEVLDVVELLSQAMK